MKTIYLEPITIDGIQRIAVRFKYNKDLKNYIKSFPGIIWNPSNRCWHIEYSIAKLNALRSYLRGSANVNDSAFSGTSKNKNNSQKKQSENKPLSSLNSMKLKKFEQWLRQRRYSESTVKNYANLVKVFMTYFGDLLMEDISYDDIILFNDDYIVRNKYSVTYQRQTVSALKLFYSQIENRKIDPEKLERPRKERKLPTVFSKEEIEEIIRSFRNIKHKAIISIIYSAGLRVSELINLRISDIDSDRMVIHIRQAKGKKDRIVGLSEKVIKSLRQYYQAYKPKEFLFEGGDHCKYSISSCRAILKSAMKRSGVTKRGSLHTLRHSFATHLLENGTDIRYIQELLGHKSSRTTEIYTHVSKKNIEDIKSPFDQLDLE